MSQIIIGSKRFHDNSKLYGLDGLLFSGSISQQMSLVGNELSAGTLDFGANSLKFQKPFAFLIDKNDKTLMDKNGKYLLARNQADAGMSFAYGTAARLYNGNGSPLLGRFYTENISHKYPTSEVDYACIDAIGILMRMPYHNGGIYTGQTAGTVIAEIFSGSGLTYSVASNVASVALYGRLKRAERRQNLGEILLATGATCTWDANGNIAIKFLDTSSAAGANNVYLDGNGISKRQVYTQVAVTEHGFYELSSVATETLFDNTAQVSSASNEIVVFDEPCFGLATTGTLTISASNANYAIVSGIGTLTGKPYTHTRKVITKSTGASASPAVKTIEDVELVTLVNSDYVAQRLAKYYGVEKRTKLSKVLDTSTYLGAQMSYTDRFGDAHSGYVDSIKYNLNPGKIRAEIEFAEGWTPGPFGSNITKYQILTASGTWTKPSNLVGGLVVLLVGGGQGGTGGSGGSPGESGGNGGSGGAVGSGGSGGKIYQTTIASPASSYTYVIGAGGAGGAGGASGAAGSAGAAGGNTTFGTLSSASGTSSASGVQNIFTKDIYGISGIAGLYAGAAGGAKGSAGSGLLSYTGGAAGTSASETRGGGAYGQGGGGGGAAYGANGGNGANGHTSYPVYEGTSSTKKAEGVGGRGGTGANASTSTNPVTNRGAGGRGGNGGGGGGGGGDGSGSTSFSGPGAGGSGGTGSAGTAGNAGVIVLFYTVSQ